MSRIVCQGLQSCLDPQLETKTLRLKLISPNSIPKNRGSSVFKYQTMELGDKRSKVNTNSTTINDGSIEISSNIDTGCWNFLKYVTNSPQVPHNSIGINTPYIHHYKPSSFSKLSDKSLALCTENLGSETGSETMNCNIFSMEMDDQESFVKERQSTRASIASRKENLLNFPPPLTSISDSNRVLMRSRCEEGRLIIKVVESTPSRTCFQVEKRQGRIRMSFLANIFTPKFDNHEDGDDNEDDEVMELENGGKYSKENYEDGEEEFEVGGDENGSIGYLKEDMDGNSFEVEENMGMGNFNRASRCKERMHGKCKLEAFWVAT